MQLQALYDFLTGAGICSGRQGNAWDVGKQLCQLAQLQVFWPEVVAPLGYTVGFVNGKQTHRQLLDECQGMFLQQAFRRQIKQFDLVAAQT